MSIRVPICYIGYRKTWLLTCSILGRSAKGTLYYSHDMACIDVHVCQCGTPITVCSEPRL